MTDRACSPCRCLGLQYIHAEDTVERQPQYATLLTDILGKASKPLFEQEAERRVLLKRASGAVVLVREHLPAETGCDIEEERGTILASLQCDVGGCHIARSTLFNLFLI